MEITTLPLAPLLQPFAVFVSGGLLEAASSAELGALLAREVALLKMLYLHVPELWVLLRGLRPRGKARASRPSRRGAGAGAALPAAALRQLLELCRAHRGLRLLAARAGALPRELRAPAEDLADKLLLPRLPGDAADVAALYAEEGAWPAAQQAARVAARLDERWQLRRLVRIAQLAEEVHPQSSADAFSAAEARTTLKRIYWIGPERVERVLGAFAALARRLRRPFRRRASAAAAWPSGRALLLGAAAGQRLAELEADRRAAEVLGDYKPVVAGLVRLLGTPADLRRLTRGELLGIIEDAKAEHVDRRRWMVWWTSAVGAQLRPPLQLRVAELAEWAEGEEGRRRLGAAAPRASRWMSWLRSWFA